MMPPTAFPRCAECNDSGFRQTTPGHPAHQICECVNLDETRPPKYQNCSNCLYFSGDSARRFCRAHPPQATITHIGVLSYQPETDADAWCGEWKEGGQQ